MHHRVVVGARALVEFLQLGLEVLHVLAGQARQLHGAVGLGAMAAGAGSDAGVLVALLVDVLADAGKIGLASKTARCAITATGNFNATSGQKIECTMSGNPKVSGKKVTLERNASGAWNCTTDLGADKAKYNPGGCN